MMLPRRAAWMVGVLLLASGPAARAQVVAAPAASFDPRFQFDGQRVLLGDQRVAVLVDAATGRELGRFAGHEEDITAVALVPGGAQVLTASGRRQAMTEPSHDNTIRLWEVRTGREVRRFERHEQPVEALAVLPQGASVLAISTDGLGRIWELATGRCLAVFAEMQPLRGVGGPPAHFAPDGRTVLTLDRTAGRVVLAATATGEPVWSVAAEAGGHDFLTAELSPTGREVLTTSSSGAARLWDARDGRALTVVAPPDGPDLRRAVFRRGDGRILLVQEDGRQVTWARDGQRSEVRVAVPGLVRGIQTEASDRWALVLWSDPNDGTVNFRGTSLIDLATGQERARWREFVEGLVVGFSPDGARVAVVREGQQVSVWDVATARPLPR